MSYSLFQATGVELEYMIVSTADGRIMPLADKLLPQAAKGGDAADELDARPVGDGLAISNELAAHVIELKTEPPSSDLSLLPKPMQAAITKINQTLAPYNARLCPGGMHPLMHPGQGELWPYGCRDIYNAYDRIFNCSGHGWVNLQSTHLNFPFAGDDEFGLLHGAIILLLPVLHALSAASPFCEGLASGYVNTRMLIYAGNQRRCPQIAGDIIPGTAYTRNEYQQTILNPVYQAIAPHDPDGILQYEWLNSRGAIARFDRGAIEIRTLDNQECPLMDLAIADLIKRSLQFLTSEGIARLKSLLELDSHKDRVDQYQAGVRLGQKADLKLRALRVLTGSPLDSSVGGWWQLWLEEMQRNTSQPDVFTDAIQYILEHGTLAERMLAVAGQTPTPDRLQALIQQLATCLADGTPL